MKKSLRTILIAIVLLLAQVAIVFLFEDNDLIVRISMILLGVLIGIITLHSVLTEYSVKTMIDNDIKDKKVTSKDLLKRSIIISLVIFVYTFVLIGSTVSTSNTILIPLMERFQLL